MLTSLGLAPGSKPTKEGLIAFRGTHMDGNPLSPTVGNMEVADQDLVVILFS